MDSAKDAVRRQYAAVRDAYVRSAGHATGDDLGLMVERASPSGNERLLDIATGGGHVARVFAPHVREVVASDLTPEILAHATTAFRDWGLTNVTTVVADAEDLPFEDASFDIVTCRIAPHHFPHPDRFVAEAARVLNPGGRFLLVDSTVPPGEDGEFFNAFERVRDHSHIRSLTIDEWTALLRTAGFEVSFITSYRKKHDFADWTARSRTGESDRLELERMLRDTNLRQQQAFEIEFCDGLPPAIVSFVDTKTLFHAVLPPDRS